MFTIINVVSTITHPDYFDTILTLFSASVLDSIKSNFKAVMTVNLLKKVKFSHFLCKVLHIFLS